MKTRPTSALPTALALALSANLCHAGLIGHWKLDESEGSVAADSGGANPGTIASGVTVNQTGMAGGAFLFNGTTDARVEIGNASFLAALEATPAMTMAGWVKSPSTAPASPPAQTVLFIGSNAFSDRYYQLGIRNSTGLARGVVRSGNITETVGPNVLDDQWHHLVTTIEVTGGSSTIRIYVDGELKKTDVRTDTAPTPINDVEIGRLGRSNPADFFTGLIDDVQLYDEVLDADQIASLFNHPGLTVPQLELDTDDDGMPDYWEIANGTLPAVDDADVDNDANGGPDDLTNLEEYENGTNPQDSDTDDDTLTDGIEVKALHASGFASNPRSTDGDGDGISDFNEHNGTLNISFANAATNPLASDTDGDGLPDAYELACNTPSTALDPNDDGAVDPTQAASSDRDSDGLSNIAEFDPAQGPNSLSPQTRADIADTDGDGYDDFSENNAGSWLSETNTGTNPVVPDSDGDGIPDGDENPDTDFAAGVNPGSNPNLADSDFDGFRDNDEFTQGFDPSNGEIFPVLPPVLAREDFNYADATPIHSQTGGSGWTGAWNTTTGQYLTTGASAAGQNQRAPGDFTSFAVDHSFRSFPGVGSGTLYLTFTASIPSTTPSSGAVDGILTSGVSLFAGGVTGTEWSFLGFRNDFFRLDGAASGNANDRSTAPGTATANTPVRFVLEVIFDPGAGGVETFNAYVFTNNQIPTELPAVPTLSTSYNIGDGVLLDAVRLFDNQETIGTFDNIELATDFSEIAGDGIPARVTSVVLDGGELVIDFIGKADTGYVVTKSGDLVTPFGPLTPPQTVTTDGAGVGQATIPASETSASRGFFRLEEVIE